MPPPTDPRRIALWSMDSLSSNLYLPRSDRGQRSWGRDGAFQLSYSGLWWENYFHQSTKIRFRLPAHGRGTSW
jgi:hypothetical protein